MFLYFNLVDWDWEVGQGQGQTSGASCIQILDYSGGRVSEKGCITSHRAVSTKEGLGTFQSIVADLDYC